ncbi:MAG: MarR family transcriptional regulator [Candidatus Methanomethylophilaceae archaeon]|nr:MarR family transcriptional regulator [Candidatus Methanomethylophilaceae archaeon]
MADDKYDCLKLENQVCFPLYACSKEIINRYRPLLDKLDITYTQYITMMVLWDKKTMSVKSLGQTLYLDSGTMSPVLKNLESKGYVSRTRSTEDERTVLVSVTDKGMALREKALTVPEGLSKCIDLPPDKWKALYDLLYEVLGAMKASENQ